MTRLPFKVCDALAVLLGAVVTMLLVATMLLVWPFATVRWLKHDLLSTQRPG
jgi:hypothetical protein